MNSISNHAFVETREYLRFAEFCDACLRDRYIGLCYGPPGVGKTLSARRYANWDLVSRFDPYDDAPVSTTRKIRGSHVIFHTPSVVNTAAQLTRWITYLREKLERIAQYEVQRKYEAEVNILREKQTAAREAWKATVWGNVEAKKDLEKIEARLERAAQKHRMKIRAIPDPTNLLIIDEADRLKMIALEQLRSIFDKNDFGVVLIGMPGLEKRLVRYPQLYSRIGFVHEFRVLSKTEVRQLLQERRWLPPGVRIPDGGLDDEEGIAAILRITAGNFRLLHRLLTQIGRILEINDLQAVTSPVVEVARENLVIGAA